MRDFHIYHKVTGVFAGRTIRTDDCAEQRVRKLLELNTPADHAAIEGQFDHLSQRVDVQTGAVVDYVPPQPSADHEWSTTHRRWMLSTAAVERRRGKDLVKQKLATLEAFLPQLNTNFLLGKPGAKEKLAAVDEEIEKLKAEL